MDSLETLIGELFSKNARGAEFARYVKILTAWPAIAGDTLSKVATPHSLKGKTLSISVREGAWANEILLMTKPLSEKIYAHTGVVVDRLRTMQGTALPEKKAPQASTNAFPERALTEREERLLETIIEKTDITHDALRETYRRALTLHIMHSPVNRALDDE